MAKEALSFTLEIPKLRSFRNALNQAPKDVIKHVGEALRETTLRVRNTAKDLIITGRGYKKAPYDTGKMYRSIRTDYINELRPRVYADTSYAYFPHEGAGTSKKYGRRPFFEDAIEENRDFAEKELERQIDSALIKVSRRTG